MIGAKVLDELQPDAENRAIAFRRHFVIIHMAAPMDSAHEILAARFDPLNGLTDLHRHEAHQRLFGVDVQLTAKSTADLGRYYMQTVFRKPEHLRYERPHKVWDLGRRIKV